MHIGGFYYPVHFQTGIRYGSYIDSLQSFWPGLQVLAGETSHAIRSHHKLWQIWDK